MGLRQIPLICLILLLPQLGFALSEDQRETDYNRESVLLRYLNNDIGDIANVPDEGLQELNQKIWRYHEFDERYMERDELDMLFIESHLKHRNRRSAVVLIGKDIAALVWLDERTFRAKHVSTFTGRNIYRIKQIGLDRGLIVRAVTNSLGDPAKPAAARAPASTMDIEKNAMGFAEALVKENPLPKPALKPYKPLRYQYILK